LSGLDLTPRVPQLAWVHPNGTFNQSALLDPKGTRHLAWVVTYELPSDEGEYTNQLILYIDAGNGQLLGGDSVSWPSLGGAWAPGVHRPPGADLWGHRFRLRRVLDVLHRSSVQASPPPGKVRVSTWPPRAARLVRLSSEQNGWEGDTDRGARNREEKAMPFRHH
jgi:hypothetical protein